MPEESWAACGLHGVSVKANPGAWDSRIARHKVVETWKWAPWHTGTGEMAADEDRQGPDEEDPAGENLNPCSLIPN
jgi:hypothetical protein